MSSARLILHVDLDAFYASVEQLEQPELAGRPVIVGGSGQRGVVSAASYEARRFGVGSAMPMSEARRRCPDGHFLPVRMDLYREYSRRVFAVFHAHTPHVEGLSLDEAFLDFSDDPILRRSPEALAETLREAIRNETGLTASVGAAPNKFVAKLASDLAKPDGYIIVPEDGVRAFLDPLPVSRLWGVGQTTADRLKRAGYATFGALRRAPEPRIRGLLGRQAPRLKALAAGEDNRPVTSERTPKSISREQTFDRNLGDYRQVRRIVAELADEVAARLRDKDLLANGAAIKLRTPDFQTHTRQARLDPPSNSSQVLRETAADLLEHWWQEAAGSPRLRLIGVGTRELVADAGQQSLFDNEADNQADSGGRRDKATDRLLDEARKRFGPGILRRGPGGSDTL